MWGAREHEGGGVTGHPQPYVGRAKLVATTSAAQPVEIDRQGAARSAKAAVDAALNAGTNAGLTAGGAIAVAHCWGHGSCYGRRKQHNISTRNR